MMWGNHWMFGGYMWIVWLVVLVVVVLLFKSLLGSSNTRPESGTETAMQILQKRYAKGEISQKEFEEKKKTLTVCPPPGSGDSTHFIHARQQEDWP